MSKSLYTKMVPTPNRKSMNSGLSAAKVKTLKSIFGDFPQLPENCGACKNAKVNHLLETCTIGGKFKITLIKPALDALERALLKLKKVHPDLFAMLGNEGGICYRRVRGGASPSNHAAGTAIDFTVNGVLPEMDTSPESPQMIPNGFVILYGYLHEEGFFWAAGYAGGRVDAMHFEVADETLREWDREGRI